MTSEQLELLCSIGSPMAEPVGHIPAATPDATATSMTARVRRGGQTMLTRDERETVVERQIQIVIFATAHATYGGVASPAVGDTWQVPEVYGGSAVDWKAGAPVGSQGTWIIPATRVTTQELGGDRRGR